jgi:hypothetical protein
MLAKNPYQNAASSACGSTGYQWACSVANAYELDRNIPGTPVCLKECL